MRSQHIWKEKDAEGRKREVRVTKFGGVLAVPGEIHRRIRLDLL